MKRLFLLLFMVTATLAGAWQPVNENAPEPAREFRAAWVATVFNLDWPSKAGLPASQQKAELLSIIERTGSDRFAVTLDTGHLNMARTTTQRAFILRAGDRLRAIHIADNLSADHKLLIGTVDDCRNRLILY